MLTLFLFVACDSSDPVVGDDSETNTGKTPTGVDVPALAVNEFLASNIAAYEDPANPGDFDDWVEIYNAGADAVSLAGIYLTDDPDLPTKFALPEAQTLGGKEFLVIWCDDQPEQGVTHAPFKLNRSADFLALFLVDGGNDPVRVDAVEFTDQAEDVAFGRVPDGSASWKALDAPTPGASNR